MDKHSSKKYKDKLEFVHFNHDCIVDILQKNKSVDTTLSLTGKISVEDMNFMRVMVGRLPVEEIHRLFSEHGNRLLERNIRRYLGLSNSRVNSDIYSTLLDKERADKFYCPTQGGVKPPPLGGGFSVSFVVCGHEQLS